MADHPECVWTGGSGKRYTYYVWPRQPEVASDQTGNYIYAKKNAKNQWVPIYIGEGDLSVRCTSNHHQHECIDLKGATAVHMHKNADDAARWSEESDLLAAYPSAYAPTGCNIKSGG
jgi:hypothetical protein